MPGGGRGPVGGLGGLRGVGGGGSCPVNMAWAGAGAGGGGEAKASLGHDAWCMHTRKEGQGLDPQRVWGVPLSATRLPVGRYGSTPRWRWLPAKAGGGRGGAVGASVAAGAWRALGGGGGAVSVRVGVRAREWGGIEVSSESQRAADRGRGAAGAGHSRSGSPGRSWCWGPRLAMGPAPRSAGTNPAKHHPRGRILVEAGGVPHRPLAAELDRDRPHRMYTGGAGGAGHRGSEARVPVVRGSARGRPGGPWGCGWGGGGGGGGGGGRAVLARGRIPRGPRGLGEGPRGRPLLGGGLLPAWGTTGAPLERGGGGGRVSPGVGPCRFMAARQGTISPTLRAGVPFLGRAEGAGGGGGGLAVVVRTPPCGGGRRWELRPAWPKKPGGVPWARGPLRGRTSDSPGGPPLRFIRGRIHEGYDP